MRAEANLEVLLAGLSPRLRSGEYVFVVADGAKPVADSAVVASVVEPEGLSLVLTRHDAERAGLPYDFVAGWITLEVRSTLDAVGLTAAVAAALGEAGISCNVLAGYHHDHLLVPHERVEEAVAVLDELSGRYR
ncbi:MAG: ACT domain-containing protein [Acidimicrobiales bacterium]